MEDDKQPTTPPGAGAPEEMGSPLKPLLWLLIPFVLVLLYGIFSHS
jgi:hypothetical protein